MYEDTWYSFPTERRSSTQGQGHRRRASLLQQPNGANPQTDTVETLDSLFEEDAEEHEDEIFLQARADGLVRRARSYPDIKAASIRPKWAAAAAEAAALSTETATATATAATGPAKKNNRRDKPPSISRRRTQRRKNEVSLEALAIADSLLGVDDGLEWRKLQEMPVLLDAHDAELLEASQQEFLTYRDQLDMTERHLGQLVDDTSGALRLLSSLVDSFRSVEEQTTSFQAQCDDLVSEQRRLKTLADEVGTDLHYYGYLDNATRRLNAPGAGRLADTEELSEILTSLDSCIHFMAHHKEYRDAESYLARYQSLLTKSLHLLEVGFTARLDKVSTELSKQIAATKSDAAQHALAYGRFEELLVESSYSLVPNVQQVIASAYTQLGAARTEHQSYSIYSNTANNIFRTYLQWRDQILRPIVQQELGAFQADTKDAKSANGSTSVETASRGFIRQSFERSYHEVLLFARVFAVEPQYSANTNSVFATLRAYRSDLVNAVNVVPLATLLQAALSAANDLAVVCNVLGWVTHEYLLLDYDDDDNNGGGSDVDNGGNDTSYLASHSRQMAARLLAEHLWVFADALFEAEVAKTITKVPVVPEALKIAPVANGQAASNAYPPVRRAIELLVMFDQAMPKERCQRNSPVVFKIVKETILALQRAEARIKSARISTDPDLFMIKNLLILKNELLSLEIGDIRNDGSGVGAMQHFGQIWDALSLATNLVGYFSTFIPGTSLWSRATGAVAGSAAAAATVAGNGYASVSGKAASVVGSMAGSTQGGVLGMLPNGPVAPSAADQDVSEQLDEALRRSINAFTQRWGKQIYDGTSRKLGGKNVAKIERELDELLQTAFSNQPEVVAKLKEAIQNVAQAANEQQSGNKISRV
ncbi:golgi family complex component [Sporothrix brasiliensis 5110]|uniref:Conserved oligomeric Golgi complex subunit 3 n=1 Tax=Sporothrix brasiliensis 5110 TaxID=1398154 RepID=A0A0C2ERM5_9PEZI|nr:golgi family complex component [Sporothrix brasiliensis 5110]KIH89024.1 golgi family complex component [Sporothrix brasiliensis 5110]